jgi:hypothetical protein
LAAVLTEIYLCNVCSCQEILRRNGRGQELSELTWEPQTLHKTLHMEHPPSLQRRIMDASESLLEAARCGRIWAARRAILQLQALDAAFAVNAADNGAEAVAGGAGGGGSRAGGREGETPLSYAAANGHVAIVALVSGRFHILCGRFDWDLPICCVLLS